MNILILIDWQYPCDHQFLKKVYAENLNNKGHKITWVMRPSDQGVDRITHERWNKSDVFILPTTSFDPIRNYLRYKVGQIEHNELFSTNIRFEDYDIVHVRNDLSMGLAAAKISKMTGTKFVYQISHLKSESLIEVYKQGHGSRIEWAKGQLGRRLRKSIADQADYVLPISDAMEDYLKNAGYTTPMRVLPTGTEIIDKIPDTNSFKEKYNLSEKDTLLYMGTFSPVRELEFLFDVIKNIRHDTELLMVGGRFPERKKRLEDIAVEKGVSKDVTFTGWIDNRTEIKQAISLADIGVSPVPTGGIYETNAPIKTLEYMSLGTPVIASATPDQQAVLRDSGGGLAVEHSVEEFSNAVEYLLNSPGTKEIMGKRGREYISKNRNFDVLSQKVEEIYEEVITGNQRFK